MLDDGQRNGVDWGFTFEEGAIDNRRRCQRNRMWNANVSDENYDTYATETGVSSNANEFHSRDNYQ